MFQETQKLAQEIMDNRMPADQRSSPGSPGGLRRSRPHRKIVTDGYLRHSSMDLPRCRGAMSLTIRPAVASDAQKIGVVFDAAVREGWTYLGDLAREPMS